jgi:hypothetical protein
VCVCVCVERVVVVVANVNKRESDGFLSSFAVLFSL